MLWSKLTDFFHEQTKRIFLSFVDVKSSKISTGLMWPIVVSNPASTMWSKDSMWCLNSSLSGSKSGTEPGLATIFSALGVELWSRRHADASRRSRVAQRRFWTSKMEFTAAERWWKRRMEFTVAERRWTEF